VTVTGASTGVAFDSVVAVWLCVSLDVNNINLAIQDLISRPLAAKVHCHLERTNQFRLAAQGPEKRHDYSIRAKSQWFDQPAEFSGLFSAWGVLPQVQPAPMLTLPT